MSAYRVSRSRWWLVLLAVTLAAVGFSGYWVYERHLHELELQKALADTDRREPDGWQLEDLERRRRPVSDEENSGLLLHAAKKLRPSPPWMYWEGGSTKEDDEERAFEAIQHLNRMEELEPNRLLSDLQYNALRNELCRGHEFMAAVRKGAERPWGRYPIKYTKDGISTLLPYTQDSRHYASALTWAVMLEAHRGELAAALEDCRGIVYCGRSVGDEPTLISVLVRLAARARALKQIERVLGHGEPPDEALARLQRVLEEEEAEAILVQGARGERALLDCMMQALQRGDLTYAQVRTMLTSGARGQLYGLEDWAFWATSGSSDLNRAALLRLTNRFVDIAEGPVEDVSAAVQELNKEAEREPKFVRTLFPAVAKVSGAYVRIMTKSRCVRVLLAAERYRQQHGRWPEKLEELVPEFLDKVPLDPFNGRPLRWLRREDGWTVYSVSRNGVDDGGHLSEDTFKKSTDLGHRAFDVDQRRRPHAEPIKVP